METVELNPGKVLTQVNGKLDELRSDINKTSIKVHGLDGTIQRLDAQIQHLGKRIDMLEFFIRAIFFMLVALFVVLLAKALNFF